MQALGVAIKLTFQGQNQLAYLQFYVFLGVSLACTCGRHVDPQHTCTAHLYCLEPSKVAMVECLCRKHPLPGQCIAVCCLCCVQIVVACLLTQMNYLNKSLDLFNTAIVSPIYYVMFTLLTIIASVIMFQVR